MKDQLGLFGDAGAEPASAVERVRAKIDDEERSLASRVPRWIRFGTSSWSFPSWPSMWEGKPSEQALAKTGLRAYAEHPLFRTVGLDRSYYGPLRAEDLAAYSAQLDAAGASSFRMVSKVWDEITTAVFPRHPRYGARAGAPNPAFLDVDRFLSEVLEPYGGSAFAYAGPFVFELTPMPKGAIDERSLTQKIDAFLTRLPSGWSWAFELRNGELLGPRWFDVLRAHGAAHVFTYWTAMPSVREQLRRAGGRPPGRVVVARLMLPPFTRYEAKKADFAPFDRLVEPQPEMRDDVVALLRAAHEDCEEAFVIVNNKAEGSSPLTVRALAARVSTEL